MGIIQCSERCRFQLDGYCCLEKCSTVSSPNKGCPYFVELSADNRNSLTQASNTDNL